MKVHEEKFLLEEHVAQLTALLKELAPNAPIPVAPITMKHAAHTAPTTKPMTTLPLVSRRNPPCLPTRWPVGHVHILMDDVPLRLGEMLETMHAQNGLDITQVSLF